MKIDNNLYGKILDISNIIIIILDRDANISFINSKGKSILGYRERELEGKNWINNFIPEAEREETWRVFKGIMEGDLRGLEYHENHIVTGNGRTLLIAWHNSFLYGDDGKVQYTISSGDDITEKRRVEEELKQTNEELKETLNQLKLANKKLFHRERMEILGQMSAGLAHHFNNLLTGIMGNTEILRMDPMVRSTHSHELDEIMRASSRVSELIGKMLDFSMRSLTKPTVTDLRMFTTRIIGHMKALLPENIAIKLNIDCTDCNLAIDQKKLEKIIINIIMNAIESMENGGTIEITLARETLQGDTLCSICGEKLAGSWYTLKIRDTGHGIPEEIKERIFEPFFTTRGFGKGLGLSQAFGLVEQFKGHIKIESIPKRGTTVSIYFPNPN